MDERVDNVKVNEQETMNGADAQVALENMSDDELMDAFAEQLMTDKGLKELDDATFGHLKDDLKERLNFQISRAILAQLPEDKLTEMNEKLDRKDNEAVEQILAEAKIDIAQTTQDTMLTFRDAYLGATEKAGA